MLNPSRGMSSVAVAIYCGMLACSSAGCDSSADQARSSAAGKHGDASAHKQVTLTIAAAASLHNLESDLRVAWSVQSDVELTFIFGATGVLQRQLSEGAPYDVFLAADEFSTETLFREQRTRGEPMVFARGRVVLWQRLDSKAPAVTSLKELTHADIRQIAIASPDHAPYGAAAVALMRAAGLLELLKPKLVFGGDVRQAFIHAQRGDVDVALVAASIADPKEGRVTPLSHDGIGYVNHTAVISVSSEHSAEAERFMAFLASSEVAAILNRYGLEAADALD